MTKDTEPGIASLFPCPECGKTYVWPYEAAACERHHAMGRPMPKTTRSEKLLMRLLALVDPAHADAAGQIADELLDALRK